MRQYKAQPAKMVPAKEAYVIRQSKLSIGDRELLISGTCDTCWQELFGSDEDEEE